MAKGLTQRAIKTSFIKLLNERPLDKISVKDIVEDCGVNRNTFYYHFQDIYALVADILEEEARKVLGTDHMTDQWQESFIQATQFAMENRRAVYHIYNSVNREKLEQYLLQISDDLMGKFVRAQAAGLDVDEEDLQYITAFYKYAVAGIILDWLQNRMKDDPEYIIRKMGELFDGNIRYTLEMAANRKKQNKS